MRSNLSPTKTPRSAVPSVAQAKPVARASAKPVAKKVAVPVRKPAVAAKPVPLAKPAAASKPAKHKKVKMVRDKISIPETEYLVLAEALIHEHSHGKLNALAALTPLLADTAGAFESPLRPDPRPLGGVLLAAHALVPMAELHRRLRAAQDPRALTADAVRRGHGLAAQARDATRTLLDHARPSAPAQALLEELRRWCESC